MKSKMFLLVALSLLTFSSVLKASAEDRKPDYRASMQQERPKVWKEDVDGQLDADEYRAITEDGMVTRRPCPYTCEDRGISRASCKEWKSKDNSACYVQDTSKPQKGDVVR